MKRCVLAMIAMSAIAVETAQAGPILLATFRAGNSLSTPQIVTNARPVLAITGFGGDPQAIVSLFDEFSSPTAYPADLNETVDIGNDQDFKLFTGFLTDGQNDSLVVLGRASDGRGLGGGGGPESDIIFNVERFGPDLVGYRIDHIIESVTVNLQSPGSDPFDDGINTDWSVSGTYEIYGTPIPEPATIYMILTGICIAVITRFVYSGMILLQTYAGRFILLSIFMFGVSVSFSPVAHAQCMAGGSGNTLPGLAGSDRNDHSFPNQCLATSGTNVTITIEAMADLGCNAFDGTHSPPSGSCPNTCSPTCCDTSPTAKYVTVSANNNSLSPSISGSSNMPTGGRFFQDWNTDCLTSSTACLEAGRSPCDPDSPAANKRIVTIPASTWNAWLGASGNTMTISASTTAAVASAPLPERSLALYCQNLGFNLCPFQSCSGLCGPSTFSRVSTSYSPVSACNSTNCTDTSCQFRSCQGGSCVVTGNKSSGTACGSSSNTACTNPDTCDGAGSCMANDASAGSPCGDPTDTDCTNPDTCDGAGSCLSNHATAGTICDDGLFCNGPDTCDGSAACLPSGPFSCPNNIMCDENLDACICSIASDCDDGDACTGVEDCVSGICVFGTPVNCDDGNDCTTDTCNDGACTNTAVADTSPCDDGLGCSITDQCKQGLCVGLGRPCGNDLSIRCNENPNRPTCDQLDDTCDGDRVDSGLLGGGPLGFGSGCPQAYTIANAPMVASPVRVRTWAQGFYHFADSHWTLSLDGVGVLLDEINSEQNGSGVGCQQVHTYIPISTEDWNAAVSDVSSGVGTVQFTMSTTPNIGCNNCTENAFVFIEVTYLPEDEDCNGNGVRDSCECPAANIDFVNTSPPSGTVDARQPHSINDASDLEGIGDPKLPYLSAAQDQITIVLDVPIAEAANAACWSLCETMVVTTFGPNAITGVTDLGGGQYQIALARPITAGAATTLRYLGGTNFVTYLSSPANVNGDSNANSSDIISLVDDLNNVSPPAHGMYSEDHGPSRGVQCVGHHPFDRLAQRRECVRSVVVNVQT